MNISKQMWSTLGPKGWARAWGRFSLVGEKQQSAIAKTAVRWEWRCSSLFKTSLQKEVTGRGWQPSPTRLPPFNVSGVQMMRTACNVLVIKTDSLNGPFLGSTAWDLYRLLTSSGGPLHTDSQQRLCESVRIGKRVLVGKTLGEMRSPCEGYLPQDYKSLCPVCDLAGLTQGMEEWVYTGRLTGRRVPYGVQSH